MSTTVVSAALATGLSIRRSDLPLPGARSQVARHSPGVSHARFACVGLVIPKPSLRVATVGQTAIARVSGTDVIVRCCMHGP